MSHQIIVFHLSALVPAAKFHQPLGRTSQDVWSLLVSVHLTCSDCTLQYLKWRTRLIGPCKNAVGCLSAVSDQVTVPVSAATPSPATGDGSLHTCHSQNYWWVEASEVRDQGGGRWCPTGNAPPTDLAWGSRVWGALFSRRLHSSAAHLLISSWAEQLCACGEEAEPRQLIPTQSQKGCEGVAYRRVNLRRPNTFRFFFSSIKPSSVLLKPRRSSTLRRFLRMIVDVSIEVVTWLAIWWCGIFFH